MLLDGLNMSAYSFILQNRKPDNQENIREIFFASHIRLLRAYRIKVNSKQKFHLFFVRQSGILISEICRFNHMK